MANSFKEKFDKVVGAGLIASMLSGGALAAESYDGQQLNFDHVEGLSRAELNAAMKYHEIVREAAQKLDQYHLFEQKIEDLMEGRTLDKFITELNPNEDYSEEAIRNLMEAAAHRMLSEVDNNSLYESKSYEPDLNELGWGDPEVSFDAYVLNGNIVVFDINKMTADTDDQIRQTLKELYAEYGGNISSIILDVRNNGGGSVKGTYDIIDDFTTDTTIGSFEARNDLVSRSFTNNPIEQQEDSETYHVKGSEHQITDIPMAVLVDYKTASAAELLAGSLQEMGRAIVVGGTPTYGKASGQHTFSLENFSDNQAEIAITTGYLNLPVSGVSWQAIGIVPNITVYKDGVSFAGVLEQEKQKELYVDGRHRIYHESDAENHIENTDGYVPQPSQETLTVSSTNNVRLSYQNLRTDVNGVMNMSGDTVLLAAAVKLNQEAKSEQDKAPDTTAPSI